MPGGSTPDISGIGDQLSVALKNPIPIYESTCQFLRSFRRIFFHPSDDHIEGGAGQEIQLISLYRQPGHAPQAIFGKV